MTELKNSGILSKVGWKDLQRGKIQSVTAFPPKRLWFAFGRGVPGWAAAPLDAGEIFKK